MSTQIDYSKYIKTPSDLKAMIANTGKENYFFTRKTMSFFGDTMRNYGIRKYSLKDGRKIIELYRKRPVKHGLNKSAFFDACTMEIVFDVKL